MVAANRHIELLTEFAPSHISLPINIELLPEFRQQNSQILLRAKRRKQRRAQRRYRRGH